MNKTITLAMALAMALAVGAACSDDSENGGQDGSAPGGDGSSGKLWPCTDRGKACNAHDLCAINPVCGEDLLCHPSFYMNCDDKLTCTTDECGASGQCKHKTKTGWCALRVVEKGTSVDKCVSKGSFNPSDPCQKCDPATDPNKWSDASGAKCDDKNACTKDDVCKDGVCQGTSFAGKCSDGLSCTDDICDGKGGCTNKLKSGYCVIDKQCYKAQQQDKAGCALCDPAKDAYKWTALPNLCKIGAACYKPGDKDGTGCGVCDPSTSSSTWSPATDACWIDGSCYKKGDKDGTGCGVCDPTKSLVAWTPTGTNCLVDGACYASGAKSATGCGVCDAAKSAETWTPAAGVTTTTYGFEAGLGGFTVDAAVNKVGWQVSSKRAKVGKSSLYYGDPASGTYDNGATNKGSASSAAVSLPAGKKSALFFWLYMDTETAATLDVLTVKAGGAVVWTKSKTTMGSGSFQRWVPVEVDLSSKAGSSLKIEFAFDTKDSWSNGGEGIYLDDVKIVTGCGS